MNTPESSKPKVYWLYNETFRHFHPLPLAGKRAEKFLKDHNECKNGRWVLVSSDDYDKYQKVKGQYLDYLLWLKHSRY